jgi:hypothetical protein
VDEWNRRIPEECQRVLDVFDRQFDKGGLVVAGPFTGPVLSGNDMQVQSRLVVLGACDAREAQQQ